MSHENTVIDRILSLHQHIITLHRNLRDDRVLKKVDDFMLSLQNVGLLEGIEVNGKRGRYFLIDGKSWNDARRKMEIEAAPNFVIWEESEFFSFLDSLLKPLGSLSNKELVNS